MIEKNLYYLRFDQVATNEFCRNYSYLLKNTENCQFKKT